MRRIADTLPIVFLSCGVWAQSPPASVEPPTAFEVASVRPAAPNPEIRIPQMYLARGGPGSKDPGQINYSNISLRELLRLAYGLKLPYQFSGPSWMENEKYDIVAKVPPGVTRDQFNVMLQNLLVERFGLVVHREARDVTGYELSIAKGGPKFKESATAAPPAVAATPKNPDDPPRLKMEKDRDGRLQLPPGNATMVAFGIPGGGRFSARQQPISALTGILESPLGKPIVDKTGLTGKYDFNLEFTRDERTSANFSGGDAPGGPAYAAGDGPPDLFTSIQDQLGLKLEQKKISVDVLVVDRAEKTPKEN